MKCPYCGQEMKPGRLHGGKGNYAVYWLPDTVEEFLFTKDRIEKNGGVVLDDVTNIGFFSASKPESYWCSNCNIFITKK